MNKQELIDKLKKQLTTPSVIKGSDFDCGHNYGIELAIIFARQLEEPEKPVIPKYVADWIEWCKKHKVTLLGAIIAVCNDKNIRPLDASGWATKNQETFTKAWFYGYEVEKEKLYTVEIPNPNAGGHVVLCKTSDGIVSIAFTGMARWQGCKNFQLTEAEIKKDFDWAWKFRKEVEKC